MTIATRAAVISCLCATMMTLSACQHSLVEEQWGQAVEANIAEMTANPGAGQQPTDPIALDGKTGEGVAKSYRDAQKRQSPTTMPSIIQIETN